MTSLIQYPFVDRPLSARLEMAEALSNADFVDGRALAFPARGACWIEVAGTRAMFDGTDSPLTQTFGLGLGITQSPSDAELEQIESFYSDLAAPVFHEVSPLSGPELAKKLADRGYRPVEFSNVMIRPLDPTQAPAEAPVGMTVRATTPDEHELWAQTAARGWQEYGAEIARFVLEVGRVNEARTGALSYLAELDGQAIAAGSMVLQDGVALLAGASTTPEFRKRGAQNALLEFRLHHAATQGCDLAMMCTEPGSGSQRNAERNGFRVAYTRTKWGKAIR